MIDLRSDTVTRPTEGMLDAMFSAKVGDDVFKEDPAINRLEEKICGMFDMESALFCPSGTMTNQIAINVHTSPGDEVICDRLSHIYQYEGGGIARNSGASVCLVDGNRGRLTVEDIKKSINPDDSHKPISKLVSLENTVNKGGGAYYDLIAIKEISAYCNDTDLKLHLDGARLFNALAETGTSPNAYGELFDSISICLSKGLGAPVGSLLLGSKAFIRKAHRVRKVFGGGMRQAGYLAAAGLYALENNIDRLKDDHSRAVTLGNTLDGQSWVKSVMPVDTNILIFELDEKMPEHVFLDKFRQANIMALSLSPFHIRLVTHLDFDDEMLVKVVQVIQSMG
jgi:threonine aldolase